jgi:outer membrane protein TolC
LQLAEFNLEDVKYRVSKELKDIFFQIELNNKRLALMKESKSMAENMLKIEEIKLKNGMISYQEWQFVVDKYKQTDQEYYDAETESLLLYVRLLKTAGLCEGDVLWRK